MQKTTYISCPKPPSSGSSNSGSSGNSASSNNNEGSSGNSGSSENTGSSNQGSNGQGTASGNSSINSGSSSRSKSSPHASLEISSIPPLNLRVGETLNFEVKVSNTGNDYATSIRVVSEVNGGFKPSHMEKKINLLAPKQIKLLKFSTLAIKNGTYRFKIIATANNGLSAWTGFTVIVEGEETNLSRERNQLNPSNENCCQETVNFLLPEIKAWLSKSIVKPKELIYCFAEVKPGSYPIRKVTFNDKQMTALPSNLWRTFIYAPDKPGIYNYLIEAFDSKNNKVTAEVVLKVTEIKSKKLTNTSNVASRGNETYLKIKVSIQEIKVFQPILTNSTSRYEKNLNSGMKPEDGVVNSFIYFLPLVVVPLLLIILANREKAEKHTKIKPAFIREYLTIEKKKSKIKKAF